MTLLRITRHIKKKKDQREFLSLKNLKIET